MQAKSYISVYLYTSSLNIDDVLVCYVKGLILYLKSKKKISNYFFIRYNDHFGPHLRLRILPIHQNLSAEIISYISDSYLSYFSSKIVVPDKTPSHIYSPYIPETQRYGGANHINICEKYFRFSSDFTLFFLKKMTNAPYDQKFSQSLLLNLIFLYYLKRNFNERALKHLLTNNINLWMANCISTVKAAFPVQQHDTTNKMSVMRQFRMLLTKQKGTLFPMLNIVWQSCEFNKFEEISYLRKWCSQNISFFKNLNLTTTFSQDIPSFYLEMFGSLIHMNNNRLGIRNDDESYLSFILLSFCETKIGIKKNK